MTAGPFTSCIPWRRHTPGVSSLFAVPCRSSERATGHSTSHQELPFLEHWMQSSNSTEMTPLPRPPSRLQSP